MPIVQTLINSSSNISTITLDWIKGHFVKQIDVITDVNADIVSHVPYQEITNFIAPPVFTPPTQGYLDDTFWEPSTFWSPIWDGTAWYYDGDYRGCSDCHWNISPIGTWATGFNPTSITFTIELTGTAQGTANYQLPYFRVETSAGNIIYDVLPLTENAGTYEFTFPLSLAGNDITEISWAPKSCLDCTDPYSSERPFRITAITFD